MTNRAALPRWLVESALVVTWCLALTAALVLPEWTSNPADGRIRQTMSADVFSWWIVPRTHVTRRRWIAWTLHGFMVFIVFNGTVVYGTGFIRWVGGGRVCVDRDGDRLANCSPLNLVSTSGRHPPMADAD